MLRFKLFGIPIEVHWFFFLLTAFLGGALRASTPDQWHRVLLFMVAAFISILVHELGHALCGLKKGARHTAIQLHGLGGSALFPQAAFSRSANIMVTAAGPAASIALAIISIILLDLVSPQLDPHHYPSLLLGHFLTILVVINVFWTIFNLCPILPLDGGQIVRDLLGPHRLKLTCIISFTTLGVAGLGLWMLTQSIYNLLLILLLGSYTWKVWNSTT